mmetsp:Transcript_39303/g.47595  ORF Transcript_39303/g.47595 Transcript_39303/m.47595 type:complete len:403 (-) Transcript_39303:207-1415(-)|eukprot:CAMPEP_0197855064 /NCGR_PEP_ID=MMETSP1438-20131217/25904_1 /TAXON_ID=1461541 /ORGANISM="Pterosperma sp., Strain CCMP1384" /LENGTH=402 /DNA_ID=CAMNT_0043470041 /DNA_START=189 /DNA_END=1397 /DNA_ORIENTATION=+
MAALSCHTAPGHTFDSIEDLKAHYKTDWHRYNLKRKAAGLPVVAKTLFEQMTARATAIKQAQEQKELEKEQKKFGGGKRRGNREETVEQQQQELARREFAKKAQGKHKKQAAKVEAEEEEEDDGSEGWMTDEEEDDEELEEAEEDETMEGGDSEEDDKDQDYDESQFDQFVWDSNTCIFSCQVCNDRDAALLHMGNKFGFYIPDKEYVSDWEGLLKYLAAKVQLGNMCLYCNKQFGSADAARKHMIDKSHCKVPYGQGEADAEEELEDFYEYNRGDMDVDGQIVLANADVGAVEFTTGGAELAVGRAADGSGGHVIGSRENMVYYKQKYKPSDQRDGVQIVKQETRIRTAMMLGIERITAKQISREKKAEDKARDKKKVGRTEMQMYMNSNVNRHLPRNVPW